MYEENTSRNRCCGCRCREHAMATGTMILGTACRAASWS